MVIQVARVQLLWVLVIRRAVAVVVRVVHNVDKFELIRELIHITGVEELVDRPLATYGGPDNVGLLDGKISDHL